MSTEQHYPQQTSNPNPSDQVGMSTNNDSSSSSSLYLYTFLATLLLLLGISAGIVARSIFVRRRTRRRLEEAIANGTWNPPRKPSFRLGEKPRLYDAYTSLDVVEHEHDSLKHKAGLWDTFKPVSVTLVKPSDTQAMARPSILQDSTPPQPPPLLPPPRQFHLVRLLRSGSRTPLSPSGSSESDVSSTSHPPPECNMITVAVMIAMPSPPEHKQHKHDPECPFVEFGISDVEPSPGWSLEPVTSSRE